MVSLCMQPLAEITERAQVLVFNNVCMIERQYLQEEKKNFYWNIRNRKIGLTLV